MRKRFFGTEDAVGKTFRTTFYGDTADYDVVGVYRKKVNPLEAMMGGADEKQEGYLPETILVWPNDWIYNIRLYAKEGTDMNSFSDRFSQYIANMKNRKREDVTFYSVSSEMGSVDQVMGGSVCSRRWNCRNFPSRRRHRNYEHHVVFCNRTNP